RSFQVSNLFVRLSVFENIRCAVLWSLGYRYSFWKFLADLDDANDRAEQVLEMIHLDKKRATLAMNLTCAAQRALEAGITIAGGGSVGMAPPRSRCSLPARGAQAALGAARRESSRGVPPRSLCSLPPKGAQASLGAARRES